MATTELQNTTNENLVNLFKRSIELQNGKNPLDQNQLREEILKRMRPFPMVNKRIEREVGDGHDEFS